MRAAVSKGHFHFAVKIYFHIKTEASRVDEHKGEPVQKYKSDETKPQTPLHQLILSAQFHQKVTRVVKTENNFGRDDDERRSMHIHNRTRCASPRQQSLPDRRKRMGIFFLIYKFAKIHSSRPILLRHFCKRLHTILIYHS